MRWADIVLVTPCPANTLSKIAHGLCSNLLTSLLRALAPTKPTYISTRSYTKIRLQQSMCALSGMLCGIKLLGQLQRISLCGDVGTLLFVFVVDDSVLSRRTGCHDRMV
ncbi:hypothetical protein EV424DRAFT_860248 [Suillus variegatus]|nr:hypothetical protein EV424DRAFT_860248 [Suillus variegatus]